MTLCNNDTVRIKLLLSRMFLHQLQFLLATILLSWSSSVGKLQPHFASGTKQQASIATLLSNPTPAPTNTPRAGDWKIVNRDGALCMRMSFGAQFNITYKTKQGGHDEVAVSIDPDSATVASGCGSIERFFFLYPFGASDALWYIRITFEVKIKHYYLTEVKTGWRFDKTRFKDGDVPFGNSTWEKAKSENFLHQPVLQGLTYACSEDLIVTTHVTSLRLTQIKFQPFADECKDTSDCPDVDCEILDNQKLVVGVAVVIGIVVVVALVVILACAIKRSKTKLPPYYNIQNG